MMRRFQLRDAICCSNASESGGYLKRHDAARYRHKLANSLVKLDEDHVFISVGVPMSRCRRSGSLRNLIEFSCDR